MAGSNHPYRVMFVYGDHGPTEPDALEADMSIRPGRVCFIPGG
jgi:hypothetical protein